jgi:hypothetical protein
MGPDGCRKLSVWSERNREVGEMTTNYSQAQQGKTIFGTSLLFFSQGLTWFGFSTPAGIFTLRPLNTDVAFFRAEIVIGAVVAAYGMLVWHGASHKLSLRTTSSCSLAWLCSFSAYRNNPNGFIF